VREKLSMLNKLNMVIGTFFSEVGTTLLKSFAAFDQNTDKIRGELLIRGEWKDQQFAVVIKRVRSNDYKIQYAESDPQELKTFLTGKRDFLLALLENPNLFSFAVRTNPFDPHASPEVK